MSRLKAIHPSAATGKAKELLDAVKGILGIVPNMTKVMATSPVVLESYLGFSGALAGGLLDAKTREELALLTAQENGCDHCLSAHTAIGKMVGLKAEEIVASRHGNGLTPKTTAALTFAKHVLDRRVRSAKQIWQRSVTRGFLTVKLRRSSHMLRSTFSRTTSTSRLMWTSTSQRCRTLK